MDLNKDSSGTVVFLALYFIMFLWMIQGIATNRLKLRSRHSIILLHVIIRLASQACGVAFAVLGFKNINVFIAYLILSAEGYFSLVLASFRFLVAFERNFSASRRSWLEPMDKVVHNSKKQVRKRVLETITIIPAFLPSRLREEPGAVVHPFVIIGNALIITGGSYLANAINPNTDLSQGSVANHLKVAKALRTTGQAMLFVANLYLGFALHKAYTRQSTAYRRPHLILVALACVWLFLIVRGIYGILQSAVWALSYYDPNNYGSHGFTSRFSALQDSLGVLTEWSACFLLNLSTYWDHKSATKVLIEAHELDQHLTKLEGFDQQSTA